MERGVNEIDAQNTDGFLLQNIGEIPHVNVQQNIAGWAARLQLEPQTYPTMGIVGPGLVTR